MCNTKSEINVEAPFYIILFNFVLISVAFLFKYFFLTGKTILRFKLHCLNIQYMSSLHAHWRQFYKIITVEEFSSVLNEIWRHTAQ